MEQYPPISIVVPVKNRKNMISRLLNSLLKVDYPRVEIIIVDDGSVDGTPELIEKYPVTLIRLSDSGGSAKARNIGIQKARYKIIALTDSDCIVSRSWLKELIPYLNEYDIVGGFVKYKDQADHNLNPLSFITKPTEIRLDSDINFINTGNMLMKKSVWQALGGFSGYRLEDVDFTWRALKKELRAYYIPKGLVMDDDPINFTRKLIRTGNYGQCIANLMWLHDLNIRPRGTASEMHGNILRPMILLGSLLHVPFFFLIFYSISPILMIIGIAGIMPFIIQKFLNYRKQRGWRFILLLNLMNLCVLLFTLINLQREKKRKIHQNTIKFKT